MAETETVTVYTIGHSNHPLERFLDLLRNYSIQTLADVRSRPVSRYPWFRQKALKDALLNVDLEYIYFGEELGGHPSADEMYDLSGHVVYERIAATPAFRKATPLVGELARKTRLVLMCAEGNPAECHRHPLLARVLLESGLQVQHIYPDGTLLDAKSMFDQGAPLQIPLVEPPGEDLSWRSPKRIR